MTSSWDAALYEASHSFVWRHGAGLVSVLEPRPDERVLDLGCGTGQLTARIAEAGAAVVGLDNAPTMVAQARSNYPALTFVLGDAADFRFDEPFDAVFSNAALHWVHDADGVARCVTAALRPGGRFVAEFGGHGNVGRIVGALTEAFARRGWAEEPQNYFPKLGEYAALLERHGLEVRRAELFDRPTALEHPERGLREWVEMFRGTWFEGRTAAEREGVLAEMEEALRPELYRDGRWWADYRRLRIMAVR